MGARDSNFFLSYDELLLLAEVERRNLIVFGLENGQARPLGSTLGHTDEQIRFVGLNVGGRGRVRTQRSLCIAFSIYVSSHS